MKSNGRLARRRGYKLDRLDSIDSGNDISVNYVLEAKLRALDIPKAVIVSPRADKMLNLSDFLQKQGVARKCVSVSSMDVARKHEMDENMYFVHVKDDLWFYYLVLESTGEIVTGKLYKEF